MSENYEQSSGATAEVCKICDKLDIRHGPVGECYPSHPQTSPYFTRKDEAPNTPASDQPEYRPLEMDEVIQAGDWVYKPGREDYGRVVVGRSMLFDARGKAHYCVGLAAGTFPDYGFRRPIAAEKREDTRTCGEISCDECNERYQKAVAEISTLRQALNNYNYKLSASQVANDSLQKQLAQEKEANSKSLWQSEIYRQETHRWKEALHKTETDRDNLREALRHIREMSSDSVRPESNIIFATADAALQQSEGK